MIENESLQFSNEMMSKDLMDSLVKLNLTIQTRKGMETIINRLSEQVEYQTRTIENQEYNRKRDHKDLAKLREY